MTTANLQARLREREASQRRQKADQIAQAQRTYSDLVIAAYRGEVTSEADVEQLEAAMAVLDLAPHNFDEDVAALAVLKQTRDNVSVAQAGEAVEAARGAETDGRRRAKQMREEADQLERALAADVGTAKAGVRETRAKLAYADRLVATLSEHGVVVPADAQPVTTATERVPHRVIEVAQIDNCLHEPGAVVLWPAGEPHACLQPIEPGREGDPWVPPPAPPLPPTSSSVLAEARRDVEAALVRGEPVLPNVFGGLPKSEEEK